MTATVQRTAPTVPAPRSAPPWSTSVRAGSPADPEACRTRPERRYWDVTQACWRPSPGS